MKKLAAFGTALVLFVISVIVLHFAVAGRVTAEDGGFGTWINTYKDMSYKAVAENIDSKNGTDNLVLPFTNVINSFYARQASTKTKARKNRRK